VRIAAIVVAAGRGERFGSRKQFEELGGQTVAARSIQAARSVADFVVLVVPDDALDEAHGADAVVAGGETRSGSVRSGLAAVPHEASVIVVHDAARPLASASLFTAVVTEVQQGGADGAVPGVSITDTVKLLRGAADPSAVEVTLPRERVVAVQTPQAFRADTLRRAHAGGVEGTDDASLVEAIGGRVVVVPGDAANRKVTTPEDLDRARALLGAR